jgi:hypothetical protein
VRSNEPRKGKGTQFIPRHLAETTIISHFTQYEIEPGYDALMREQVAVHIMEGSDRFVRTYLLDEL